MIEGPHGISAHDADARLHDARLDLDTLTVESGTFSIDGYALGTHAGQQAKFTIRLRVHDVRTWRLDDDARIGVLDVHDISETESGLRIESHFPTELHLTTDRRVVEIDQSPTPFSVRRWFRWRNA